MADHHVMLSDEDHRKWQALVESGSRRAEAKGLKEDDVPRLISEARRDRPAR
jgi:hypothetical protein